MAAGLPLTSPSDDDVIAVSVGDRGCGGPCLLNDIDDDEQDDDDDDDVRSDPHDTELRGEFPGAVSAASEDVATVNAEYRWRMSACKTASGRERAELAGFRCLLVGGVVVMETALQFDSSASAVISVGCRATDLLNAR